MTLPNAPPFVMVEWEDAHGSTATDIDASNIDEHHHPMVLFSSGWLLKQDREGVSICTEFTGSSHRGHTFIKHENVVAIWVIAANPFSRRKIVYSRDDTTSPE